MRDQPDDDSMEYHPHARFCEPAARLKCGRFPKQRHFPVPKPEKASATASGYTWTRANNPKLLGGFQIHRRTPHVLHVGDAQVIFEERRVVPLLRVDGLPERFYRPDWKAAPEITESEIEEVPVSFDTDQQAMAWLDGNPNLVAGTPNLSMSEVRADLPSAHELTVKRRMSRRTW